MPTGLDAHLGAAPSVDQEFLELVYADEQLLRAEFDDIIAREWPTGPPPAAPTGVTPGADPAPRRQPPPGGVRASRRQRRDPGADRWRRQRSPPRLGRGGAPTSVLERRGMNEGR